MGNKLNCRELNHKNGPKEIIPLEIQKLKVHKQYELMVYYEGLNDDLKNKFKTSIINTNFEPFDYVF